MIVRQQNVAIDPATGDTLPDRYIGGTYPICDNEGAHGDQYDIYGNQLDLQNLIDPISKVSR